MKRDTEKPGDQGQPQIVYREHNTPPPIVVSQGSLIVETKGEFQGFVTQAGHKQYTIWHSLANERVSLEHIKVLDGSGEMLYRNDAADGCKIELLLVDLTTVEVAASEAGDRLLIVTDAERSFVRGENGDRPTSKIRDTRYRLSAPGLQQVSRPDDFSITQVKISKADEVLYSVRPQELPSQGDEFRILIWSEKHPRPNPGDLSGSARDDL